MLCRMFEMGNVLGRLGDGRVMMVMDCAILPRASVCECEPRRKRKAILISHLD
jgi:hypothetical protein